MPNMTVLIEALIIGIGLIAAVNHSIMAVVVRDRRLHLLFALMALAAVVHEVATMHSYHSTSISEIVTAHRWRSGAAAIFLGIFPWFARCFSDQRTPRYPAIALSSGFALLFVLNLFAPYSLGFATIEHLSSVRLPWGETITQAVGPVTTWVPLSYMMFVALMILAARGGLLQYRRGERGPALALLISIGVFLVLVIVGFFVRIGALPFTFPGGYGFVGFVVAMTLYLSDRLRRAYHQAAECERRLRSIVDCTDAVIYIKDLGGTYRIVNRGFERLTGMTQDQVRGKTDGEIFGADCAERFRRNDLQVLGSDENIEFDEVVQGREAERTYHSVKAPLKDAAGRIYGLCCVSTDVTALQQVEGQVHRQHEEFADRPERDPERLRRINSELEAFTYAVSHDLRAPLRTVDNFSSLLVENYRHKLDENGLEFLGRIQNSSQRMSEMIDALLELSRISRKDVHKATVNLSSLGHDVIDELSRADPQRRVDVTIRDDMVADGDPALLKIALTNLLGNAWKYTGKTSDAKIEFGQLRHNGQKVFYVRDNGAGFDMAYADRLLTPFQRLHPASEFPGTGIGLSTVRRIIGRHDGKIWAEGTPGGGATFWFTL